MSYLIKACNEIAFNLRKGSFVVFESTVYPGATRDVCVPILEKLNAHAVIQVRANLSPSCFYKGIKSEFHTDTKHPSKTAIFYLNTCDGGTELKINNKIHFVKAEENKMLIFNTNTEHRGTLSTDVEFRYIINFNYY